MPHVATVTIDATKVPADQTNFVVYIDLADMPAGFWSTVLNGGGDIRCYKDDDVTPLPREVVACDTSGQTGELWVKFAGTLSGSSDTDIHIYADGVSSEPAVTDPTHGRNATWDGFTFVSHDGLTDSTGGVTPTNGGTIAATGRFGTPSGAREYDGTNDYIDTNYTTPSAKPATLSAWHKPDVVTGARTVAGTEGFLVYTGIENNGADNRAIEWASGSASTVTHTGGAAAGTWLLSHYTAPDNTERSLHTDGTDRGNQVWTKDTWTSQTLYLGSNTYRGGYYDGVIAEVRVSDVVRSDTWITTEWNNQVHQTAAFYTAAAAAGGAYSADLTAAAFNMTAQPLEVQAAYVATLGVPSISFAPQAVDVAAATEMALSAGNFSLTAQPADVRANYQAELTAAAFSLTAQPIAVRADYQAELTAPSFNLTSPALTVSDPVQIQPGAGVFRLVARPLEVTAGSPFTLLAPLTRALTRTLTRVLSITEGAE